MKSFGPANTAPKGAPKPLVKSSMTVSQCATTSLTATPKATAAFTTRAPSIWTFIPYSWATSATACKPATCQHAPPPLLAVCSTSSNRCGGA